MSYLRARLWEAGSWRAFGHSMFACCVVAEGCHWCRVASFTLSVTGYAIAAALPESKS